ncbi:hypothetical protein GPSY_4579 [Paraglaciecola psychrophila 170]|nr:hypothetical protein GPSY_4579 [Paraglaciecola psychrophila 170]
MATKNQFDLIQIAHDTALKDHCASYALYSDDALFGHLLV